ncbi:MAG: FemAB family XrtA/PEP-CTERM system-associated protein [Halobacteriota archaeon]|nr:FemAB family XrtA/PEP-CTERM system-associated protein [Halobacteriota archaeon]
MLEIQEFKNNDRERWEEFINNSNNSTFYHQIGWKDVVEKTYKHDPYYLIAEEDGEIKGVLPLFLIKNKIFGKKLVSVPFGPYGGVCADNKVTEDALTEEAKRITKNCKADYLEIRNIYPKKHPSYVTKSFYVTSVLELNKDNNVVWKDKLSKGKRKMISRSEKKNLTLEWVDKVDGFFRLFARNMRDLGSPVHSISFFKNILHELPENSKILEVRMDDDVIYSAFYLFYKDRMINSWSSTLKEYRKYLPTDFGIWNAIKYGCENGYSCYDFGRSQIDSSNFEFKRRWGTEAKELHYQYYLNTINKVPNSTTSNPDRQIFAKVWKKTPVLVANNLGPMIRKYFQ